MQNEPPLLLNEKSKKSSKNSDKNPLSNIAAVNTSSITAASGSSSSLKQPITYDINLSNAPMNETHPLMVGNRRPSSSTMANSNSNSGNNISGLTSSISNKNTKL
jgi:hypothetical protein